MTTAGRRVSASAFSNKGIEIVPVAESLSTNTGFAPRLTAGPTVAANVSVEEMTVARGPTPSSAIRRSSAAVPLATAAAC